MKKFIPVLTALLIGGYFVLADTPPPNVITANQGKPGPSPWPILVANPSPISVNFSGGAFPTPPANQNVTVTNSSPIPVSIAALPTPYPNQNVTVTNSSPIPVSGAFPTPIPPYTGPFPTPYAVQVVSVPSPVQVTGAFPTPPPSQNVVVTNTPSVHNDGSFPTPIPFPTTQNVFIVGASPVPVTGAFPTPAPTISNFALETGGHLASIDTKIPASPSQEHTTAASPNSCRLSDGAAFYVGFKSGDSIGNTSFQSTQGTSPWVSNISQFGGSNVVTGTGTSGAGIPRVTVSNDSNILSTQSGTWNINNVSGTVSLPTGASTSANQTSGGQKTQVVDGANATVGPVQTITGTNYFPVVLAASATSGSALVARSIQVAGSDGTNAQTLSTDATGKLNINNISGTVSLPTGAATSANQTNASQKTQLVDGGGVVIATNYGTAANALRVAAQIGNASAVADFNAGATGAQTLRTAANAYDGSGNAETSTTFNSKTGASTVISGQDILTVTGTGSALNGDAVAATDVAAYRSLSLQLVVSGTNTTTFQGSNDNFTNTFTVFCSNTNAVTAAAVSTAAATGLFHCPVHFRYFRARVTAFTSGSSAGTAIFSPVPSDNDVAGRDIAVLTSITNAVNTNPATFNFGTQVASAARTTSGNSGTVTQAAPNNQAVFNVQVTAASGTTPTLDVAFQESYDGGTTYTDEWHWERITGTGQFSTPNLVMNTSKFRFVWTIGGTTPSFTFLITSNQGNQVGLIQRRFFDRTVNLNSTNSTTATFLTDGCLDYKFVVNDSACTTFPSLALQSSEDNVNWETTGQTLVTTASGTFGSTTSGQQSHWSRVIVTTGGTTCTLGYVALRCTQN